MGRAASRTPGATRARYGARTTIERVLATPPEEIDAISLSRVPCFTGRWGYASGDIPEHRRIPRPQMLAHLCD